MFPGVGLAQSAFVYGSACFLWVFWVCATQILPKPLTTAGEEREDLDHVKPAVEGVEEDIVTREGARKGTSFSIDVFPISARP